MPKIMWRYVVCYSCMVQFDLGPRSTKTTIGEVMDRLRPFFEEHLGCNVEIMNTKKCDGSELRAFGES